jgi:hypothetical protein
MSSTVDVRTGSQRPRTVRLPEPRGGATGELAVELADLAGLRLDDWQRWCLTESLAENAAGRHSAFEVAILVGRQNGKGSILEARQLAGLFLLGERLQVHTAHEFKTCFEHFLRVVSLIESAPELDAKVQRVRRGAGEQAIELKSGERLRFVARSSGSGRGMSGDAVYLDEAFALTPQMMGALLPTLSARPNPQVWYTSSAPLSHSAVLHQVVKRGRDGGSDRLFFAEWSNELGVDPDDRDAWYRANPALGIRISEEFVAAELDALREMPDEFARERLGVVFPPPADRPQVKLPTEEWAATVTDSPPAVQPGAITIAFDVSLDGAWGSIAVGAADLAAPYVELVEHREGSGWIAARMVELVQKWQPIAVGCNGAGPAGAQVHPVREAFARAGIEPDLLKQMSAPEYKQACGGFFTDVVEGRLVRPGGQGPLDLAAGDASERPLGDAWAWNIRSATVPISPLVAVTIARALLPYESEEPSDPMLMLL